MANVGTSSSYVVPDLTHQLDALEVLDAAGLFPSFIQVGNELFIDDAFPDYTDMFATAEEYADRAKQFVLAIRNRFPGRNFKWGIPIVKNIQPVGTSPSGTRNTTWARRVLTRLAQSPNPLLPHGVTFHHYTTTANNTSPSSVFADVFTRYNTSNWLNYFPLPDSTHLNGTTNVEGDGRTEQDVKLWVTEWGQASQASNPTGDQWFYALAMASMGLLQLESPRLEISSPHVLFANSSWSHLQTSAPYARQNLGWGSYAINRASLGKTEARKLSFSPNATLTGGYPTLYGWMFSNNGQSNRHYVFMNLGSSAQTINVSGLGVSEYELLSRSATTLISGTDQDFINAGGLATGNLGSTLTVPAYSIVRLYGPESPLAAISVSDGITAEPSNHGQFTVTLTPAPSSNRTVNLTRSGSATNGTDYSSIPTTVTVGATGSANIALTVTNDALVEGNETVTLTLATGTGYTVGTPSSATITIADDDTSSPTTATFYSVGSQDGYVSESTETSNAGGSNAAGGTGSAALRAGDTATDQQVKTIVSFDTSSIPDGATITGVTLRLKRGSLNGTNPFSIHGQCRVDIKGGSGFGGSTALANGDFETAADAANVGQLSDAVANGNWSSGALGSTAFSWINKTGTTQFRVSFATDDNDDNSRDDMGWFPGEAASGDQPELIVTYTP